MVEVNPKRDELVIPPDHGLLITDHLFVRPVNFRESAPVVHQPRS
jgi:hypothetical protein